MTIKHLYFLPFWQRLFIFLSSYIRNASIINYALYVAPSLIQLQNTSHWLRGRVRLVAPTNEMHIHSLRSNAIGSCFIPSFEAGQRSRTSKGNDWSERNMNRHSQVACSDVLHLQYLGMAVFSCICLISFLMCIDVQGRLLWVMDIDQTCSRSLMFVCLHPG